MYNNSLISKNLQSQMTNCNENRINILQKNQKWNILIMVILVMLTASMLGLLSMSFLKEMFSYTINLDWYYKSYYLSKAWIELALTEIDNSTFWFSHSITWESNIFTQNLCQWQQDCNVTMEIIWRSNLISQEYRNSSECNPENAFELKKWESFALPLFYQKDTWTNAWIVIGNASWDLVYFTWKVLKDIKLINTNTTNENKNNQKINIQLVYWDAENIYGLYITDKDFNENAITSYFRDFDSDLDNVSKKMYLMLTNPENNKNKTVGDNDNILFCLSWNNLPATKSFVRSLWNYQWKYVWMQAIFDYPIPKFMLY